MKYDYKAVEAKWQKVWEDEKTFHVAVSYTHLRAHETQAYLVCSLLL